MSTNLQSRKQQLVREAIWDAAVALFLEKGFEQVTVEEIADQAGVSRRTFFRYFPTKNDLMSESMVSYGVELIHAIDACPKAAPISEVFRETVLRVAQHCTADERTRNIMRIAARSEVARSAQLSKMAEVQDRLATAYAKRLGSKTQHDPAPGILAGLTLSVLAVTFRTWMGNGQKDIRKTADAIFATLELVLNRG